MRDEAGTVTHFVGVQADVTARVEAQRTRDEALAQVAHVAGRLGLLADITSRMAAVRRPHEVVEMLASVLTPAGGDDVRDLPDRRAAAGWARSLLRHERQRTDPRVARAAGAAARDLARTRSARPAPGVAGAARRAAAAAAHRLLARAAPRRARSRTSASTSIAVARRRQRHRRARCRPGASCSAPWCVANDRDRPPLGESELALVQDLAVRAGLMLENTRLYDRAAGGRGDAAAQPAAAPAAASRASRSPRPTCRRRTRRRSAATGTTCSSCAAADGASGGVGVVVGDVMGHNYDSAARMGKLSTIVRSYAWPGSDPFTVLTAVDELLEGTRADFLATCVYARLRAARQRRDAALVERRATRRRCCGGPGGTTITLDDGRGPMIGIAGLMPEGARRPADAALDLPRGSTLIAFTDGLTDALAEEPDLDEGLRRARPRRDRACRRTPRRRRSSTRSPRPRAGTTTTSRWWRSGSAEAFGGTAGRDRVSRCAADSTPSNRPPATTSPDGSASPRASVVTVPLTGS